jgi:hypothetical protein
MCVTNGIPLGHPLILPVGTVNCIQTRKATSTCNSNPNHQFCPNTKGLIMSLCRADGMLLKPDKPARSLDIQWIHQAFPSSASPPPSAKAIWSTAVSINNAGSWGYVLVVRCSGLKTQNITLEECIWKSLMHCHQPCHTSLNGLEESVWDSRCRWGSNLAPQHGWSNNMHTMSTRLPFPP